MFGFCSYNHLFFNALKLSLQIDIFILYLHCKDSVYYTRNRTKQMVRQKGFEEMEKFEQYQKETAGLSGVELIRWGINTFGSEKVLLASSLSIEDQLLTHWIAEITEKPRVLTLDTGRHFNETYEVMSQSSEKYGLSYELGIPDTEELRELYGESMDSKILSKIVKSAVRCAKLIRSKKHLPLRTFGSPAFALNSR